MPSIETPVPKSRSLNFAYLHLIAGLFVATLLISNTVSAKPIQVGPFIFPGGVVLFPLSYIFGDVLTEVYGYERCRQIIWTGFIASGLMSATYLAVGLLRPPAFWTGQAAFELSFGQIPRIVLASLVAYLCGEFANSYVLAKLKIATGGRHLWARMICSTLVGQAADTFLFVVLAFFRVWPRSAVIMAVASLYGFKVLYEVALVPVTSVIVVSLKKKEQVDHFDVETKFSPFRWGISPER
jgi:uncharacterized integral membrane protein (TIGR00697 family)